MKTTDDYIAEYIPTALGAEAMRYRLLAKGLPERDVESVIKQVKQARTVNRLMIERAKACGRAL